MGNKLPTRQPLEPTPTVNVKGKEGQFFVGTLIDCKEIDSGYKDADGNKKPYRIYRFTMQDTDMAVQIKLEGEKEYKTVPAYEGDRVSIFAGSRLDYALSQAKAGQVIKIVYLGLGEKPSRGGNRPHEYDVEVVQ